MSRLILTEQDMETIKLIKDAIEKQLPMESITEEIWYNSIEPSYLYYCPICKCQLMYQTAYCNECGQKIDWSD